MTLQNAAQCKIWIQHNICAYLLYLIKIQVSFLLDLIIMLCQHCLEHNVSCYWYSYYCTKFGIVLPHFFSCLTGFFVQRWKNKWNILHLQFWRRNWLWSGCFLVSSFKWITAYGSDKVHVFWKAFNAWWKSSLVHYIFYLILVRILCPCRTIPISSEHWLIS